MRAVVARQRKELRGKFCDFESHEQQQYRKAMDKKCVMHVSEIVAKWNILHADSPVVIVGIEVRSLHSDYTLGRFHNIYDRWNYYWH